MEMRTRPGRCRGVSEDPALALRPQSSHPELKSPGLPPSVPAFCRGSALEAGCGWVSCFASTIFGLLQRALTVAARQTEEGGVLTGQTKRKDQSRFSRPGSTLKQGLLQIWEDVSVVVSKGRELTIEWLF